MWALSFSLVSLLAGASAKFSLHTERPSAITSRNDWVETDNTVPLSRKKGSRSAAYLRTIRTTSPVQGTYGTDPVYSVDYGQEFVTNIEFADQKFEVILDTGSSDTWLATSNFQCVNVTTGTAAPQSECQFGPLFTPGSSFQPIANENFNITYADGEFLTGTFGHDSVTLANITVSNQQVAAVTFAGWEGDGVTSGLVGLAFPNITSAFSGTDPAADSPATQVLYNPLFTNMYTEGSVPALFSVALDRNNGTGVLAIGGTPPGLDLTQPNASAPFQYLKVDGHAATSYQFYTIDVSAVVSLPPGDESSSSSSPSSSVFGSGAFDPVRRARKPRAFQAIVDSGTTLLYLPDALAAEFNALWDPPAEYDAEEGVYAVACDAVPAGLDIVVNGTGFALDAADLVLDGGEADGSCISGVAGAGQGFSIIGDVFLKSVLAVFDVGGGVVGFVRRVY